MIDRYSMMNEQIFYNMSATLDKMAVWAENEISLYFWAMDISDGSPLISKSLLDNPRLSSHIRPYEQRQREIIFLDMSELSWSDEV
jgi:hypothetical protein